MRIGDLRLEQGDLEGALEAHRESLAIATRGAIAQPANSTWQRDLAVIHFRLSYTLKEAGDLVLAREHAETCVSIYGALAQTDPRWRSELTKLESYLEQMDEGGDQPAAVAEPPATRGPRPHSD